jgi:hypothetical protein
MSRIGTRNSNFHAIATHHLGVRCDIIKNLEISLLAAARAARDSSNYYTTRGARMPDEAHDPKAANLEFLVKSATVLLGVVFGLGFLVSNAQLMQLGIADFSGLQLRNVMIGALFLIFLALLLSILIPTAYLPKIVQKQLSKVTTTKSKVGQLILVLLLFILLMYFAISLTTAIFAAFYVHVNAAQGDSLKDGFVDLGGKFLLAFNYVPILIASALFVAMIQAYNYNYLNPFFRNFAFISENAGSIASEIYFGLMGMILFSSILIAFANDIYPNLKFNFGGGQPQIAAVTLSGKASELAGWSGDTICCKSPSDEQAIQLPDAAIWFQSDKFIYISFLPAQNDALDAKYSGPAPVTAIDIKLVRKIVYLPKYVLISGGHIKSVHSY